MLYARMRKRPTHRGLSCGLIVSRGSFARTYQVLRYSEIPRPIIVSHLGSHQENRTVDNCKVSYSQRLWMAVASLSERACPEGVKRLRSADLRV